MIRITRNHELRVHEVTRLSKERSQKRLNEGELTAKGKSGMYRKITLRNELLVCELYEKTHKVIKKVQHYIYQHRSKFITADDKYDRILTFHGLRHSYVQERFVYYSNLGVNEKQAKRL